MLLGAEVKDAKAVLDYIIEHMQAELDTCRAVIGSWDRACVLQSEIKLFTDLRDEWQRAFKSSRIGKSSPMMMTRATLMMIHQMMSPMMMRELQ